MSSGRPPIEALRHPYEYAVRYRRENWTGSANVQFFHRKSQALHYRDKLMKGDLSLAPVVELTVERRELGPVEVLFDVNELGSSGEAIGSQILE